MLGQKRGVCTYQSNGTQCEVRCYKGHNYCIDHLSEITRNKTAALISSATAEKLVINPEQVTPAASFIKDLGADSLDAIELILDCEELFDISIPEVDRDDLETVQSICDYVSNILIQSEQYLVDSKPYEAIRNLAVNRDNDPDHEGEAFRLLSDEEMLEIYASYNLSYAQVKETIHCALAGQRIRYVTIAVDAVPEQPGVRIMLLTSRSFVSLDLANNSISSVYVPLQDLYLHATYNYEGGVVTEAVIKYHVANNTLIKDGEFLFNTESFVDGAKKFLKKYHVFRGRLDSWKIERGGE